MNRPEPISEKSTDTLCPEQDLLHAFLRGELSDEESGAIAKHFVNCVRCLQQAENPKVDDSLLSHLKAKAETAEPPELKELIGQLLSLSSSEASDPGETQMLLDTHGVSQSETHSDTPNQQTSELCSLPAADKSMKLTELAHYSIQRKIGSGGMGVVFHATDNRLQRDVALKAMKPEIAVRPNERKRFLQEARAVAAIEHDNVVSVYEVGEDKNIPYMAMPLLSGESLQDRLAQTDRFDVGETIRISQQTAAGLSAAHEKGLIHRDIKPDNIWLEAEGGRVKILDFGLARSLQDEGLTQTGAILGTPKYMSPEQVLGKKVDLRTDLFSLGAVMYHMLAKNEPFQGSSVTAVLIAVAEKDPPSLTDCNPDVPLELLDLVNQLLSKEPSDRPDSASDVVQRLQEISNQPGATVSLPSIQQKIGYSANALPRQTQPEQKKVGFGSAKWIGAGFLGAALAIALGAITIKIVNKKDGTEHEIAVNLGEGQSAEITNGDTNIKIEHRKIGEESGSAEIPDVINENPSPQATPDARIANWLLEMGESIKVIPESQQNEVWVREKKDLPDAFDLSTVYFTGLQPIGDDDLARLTDLKSIIGISVEGAKLTNASADHLAKLKSLNYINLRSTKYSADSMRKLAALPALGNIELTSCDVNGSVLEAAGDIPNLWVFGIDKCEKLTDEDFATIKGPKVTILGINRMPLLTDKTLEHVARQVPSLEHVRVEGLPKVNGKGFSAFRSSAVKQVYAKNIPIDDAGFAELCRLPTLEILEFANTNVTADGIASSIANLEKLSVLNFRDTPFSVATINSLANCPKLEKLTIGGGEYSEEIVDAICKLTRLTKLNFLTSTLNPSDLAKIRKALSGTEVNHVP